MRGYFKFFRDFSIAAALGLILGLALAPAAQASSLLEKNFWLSGPRYDGDLPPCESMLNKITERFAEKEGTFWNSDLLITGFADVREIAFRSWAANTIPRRFCSVHAMISDGRERQIFYSIIEDGGLAAYGSGLEFCVVGLDRNWAFNPACKAARP
jgi:hypothetical protein